VKNEFERLLQMDRIPERFRGAVVDVAYMCKAWFASYGVAATAADIMAMCRMVMEREAALVAEERREVDAS
jgi:hypothetical protein